MPPVTVRDLDGKAYDVRPEDVDSYRARGFTIEGLEQRTERIGGEVREDIYGGTLGKVGTAGAGALSGLTLGLSDVALDALGAGHELRALQETNPISSLGGNIAGALLPTILSAGAAAPGSTAGIGARILARTPAGLASRAGTAVTGLGEGAGLGTRLAAGTAGAGLEGALQGGGQYLSQTALEDKPLSAEGFVGAMGKGALFAAPVGGAFTLGEAALIRARSLFPRQQMTREAAREVSQEATSELAQTVADGDQMAEIARKRIALTEAKSGMAETGERVTRRMFGDADPATLADQIAGGVDRQQVQQALDRWTSAKDNFTSWVRQEADPDLEAALIGLTGPEVGQVGGRIEKQTGRMWQPDLADGTPVSPAQRELMDALDMRSRQVDVTKIGKRPANDVPGDLIQGVAPKAQSLEQQLADMQSQLDGGKSLGQLSAESPARADYVAGKLAKREADAAFFRGSSPEQDAFFANLRAPKTRDAYVAENIGQAMRDEGSHAAGLARLEREWAELHPPASKAIAEPIEPPVVESTAVDKALRGRIREDVSLGKTIVDSNVRAQMQGVADDSSIAKILGRRAGKDVDMGASLGRAAKAIGDIESAGADLVELLGPDAPVGAATRAKGFRSAKAGHAEAAASGTARTAESLRSKFSGDGTVVDDEIAIALRKHDSRVATPGTPPPAGSGALGVAANIGTALEVMKVMGVPVPDVSQIPVIGPVLSLFLKARAAMAIIGRRGGSIPRSTESVVAKKAAETRDRIAAATQKLLEGGVKAGKHVGPATAAVLGYKLFPGGERESHSKDARQLYAARMDELARAQQPGAVSAAVSDRYQTSDPVLHEALVTQVMNGLKFLDSKAPKQTVMPGVIPGDGEWHPSKTALEEFARYVHAVHDPASVLEDLAKGHATIEGAETLRVVYPKLYAEAQRALLEAAPRMQATLPYSRRVAISIMYQVPVDGTMTPQHMQFLQTAPAAGPAPAPQGPPPGAPAITGPLSLGQQTMTSLDRRAGA